MIAYRCPTCRRLYHGPAGAGLLGANYLGVLFAFHSAALGCPRCGIAPADRGVEGIGRAAIPERSAPFDPAGPVN